MLEDMDWHYLEAISNHLTYRAKAMSGQDPDDDIDWDETYGGE